MRRSTPRSPTPVAAAPITASARRSGSPPPECRREEESAMSNKETSSLSRRDLLSNAAAPTGALVVGFWMPQRAAAQIIDPPGAAWAVEPAFKEINAWVVVAPDETVTIRIAQTELGQGVWTSNAMMVCEELQCDW